MHAPARPGGGPRVELLPHQDAKEAEADQPGVDPDEEPPRHVREEAALRPIPEPQLAGLVEELLGVAGGLW